MLRHHHGEGVALCTRLAGGLERATVLSPGLDVPVDAMNGSGGAGPDRKA